METLTTVGRVVLIVGAYCVLVFVGAFCHEAYRDWRSGWRLYRDDLPYDYERDGL